MRRILVVDDEPATQELLRTHLGRQGYDVLVAEDGRKALFLLQREEVSLVLLDLLLPELDGQAVLRAVRDTHPDLPVLIITCVTDYQTAKRLIGEGARDYITKPLDFGYLDSAIFAHLA